MVALEAQFVTSTQLYRAYMPFIRFGALFFVTSKEFQLGELLSVRYQIPGDLQWHAFEGPVVWCNPLGSQGGRPPGVGVAFQHENNQHRDLIEKALVGEMTSGQLTSTM
ncbi:PilZ domain-containing protein [Ferrimonas lipolytica]|uniref:Pilus assembly protein PilZ n=1 Tax=Ferrimonas lipolytica TaxID=2724191 RepID=A0A6H1UBT1_9GAMM|nr:PilZ domain-containing protein [Ferrimonas lipolytica]QIZ76547.1 pilus assembly protein PilZ [Ferrimonas lipolytica]